MGKRLHRLPLPYTKGEKTRDKRGRATENEARKSNLIDETRREKREIAKGAGAGRSEKKACGWNEDAKRRRAFAEGNA